ncbi:hypothetical protein MMC11_000578 [Xylographa trunciseda]|nr:hypothetical protein [Xylographa trunciseda]
MAVSTTGLDLPSIASGNELLDTLVSEQSSDPVAPQMSPLSHVTEVEIHRDDVSSSLSDIEDRHVAEAVEDAAMTTSTISEADDTEAETERLEESPHKLRKHENVVFTTTQKTIGDTHITRDGSPSQKPRSIESNPHASGSMPDLVHSDPEDDLMDQTSEISSLEDTAGEVSRAESPLSASGRKRKRLSPKTTKRSESAIVKSLKQAAEHLASNMIQDNNRTDLLELAPNMKEEAAEDHTYDDDEDELSVAGGDDANDLLRPTLYSTQKSHRTDKNTDEHGSRVVDSRAVTPGMDDIDGDGADSGGEDADLDDVAQGMGTDATARNEEEVLKKKAALDSLGTIEKQFATLRDRLYEDRINHFNEELLMLNQPKASHPEYLAMVECIDKRREEKIMQANTRLRYKLETLQRKSIAERAIAHSQYMQTIRETRDMILEQANKEWYQIQRERRTYDEDDSLFLYQFTTRRSQQISRQAAYNTEVSILSGIAKYKGFPAAPVITPAKANEIEDDLRKMGIQNISQSGPARIGTSLSTISRQRPAAEEQFLEQTPWANPHHPVHLQLLSAAQRQSSLHSRPLSPFVTPAPPRRVIDTSAINGSASTIAALQSAQNSSVAPTPASGEHHLVNAQESSIVQHEDKIAETPSRHNNCEMQQSFAATSAAGITLEKDIPPSPLLPGKSNAHPEESHYAPSPPSKARPIPGGLGALSGHQPFGENADPHLDPPAERSPFAAYRPQISRQLSVSAGAEHSST